jgi:hypothetical protein
MGYNPEDLTYLELAASKGFGEVDLDRIALAGSDIASVQRVFKMGAGRSRQPYAGGGVRRWLVAPTDRPEAWRRAHSEYRYVDLAQHLGGEAAGGAWAYSEVECDRPVEVEVWLGADGPSALYLNDERVTELAPTDGHRLGEAKTRLVLPGGRSGLLARVEGGPSGFGFSLLLCGQQAGCLPLGVHYRLPDEARAAASRERCAPTAG